MAETDLLDLMHRALTEADRGLGFLKIAADEAALQHLAKIADGDARKALNALEIAALTTNPVPPASSPSPWRSRNKASRRKPCL